jgi:hypothetical protein
MSKHYRILWPTWTILAETNGQARPELGKSRQIEQRINQRAPPPILANNIISSPDVKIQVSKKISIAANMHRESNNPAQNRDEAYD